MKICWDNLEKIKYNKEKGYWYQGSTKVFYADNCEICNLSFLYTKRNKGKRCCRQCTNKGKNHHSWGKKLSEEAKQKIGKAQKGKILSEETKRKIGFGNKGKILSEETKRKISLKNKNPTKETREKMSLAKLGKTLSKETKKRMSEARKGNKNPMWGKPRSDTTKSKISKNRKGKCANTENWAWGRPIPKNVRKKMSLAKKGKFKGKDNNNYQGGYDLKNIPMYNTFAPQISYAEEVRRDPDDQNVLQVKCAYCGKWYTPTITNIHNRTAGLNGKYNGSYRLYCSKSCKQNCPIFKQRLYPKGFKPATSREVQPQLRQLVLKRDDWTCQKCGKQENLHCHHITGIMLNPLESADVDNCITLCKECHKFVHTLPDCGYNQLRCSEN